MVQFILENGNAIGVDVKKSNGKVFYTARYQADKNWIYADWQGMVTVEEVIEASSAYLELLAKVSCPNLINDNTNLTGTWDKANDWIATEWMPRALSLGLKNFAHVVSPSIFAELSAKNMEVRLENAGFTMRTCKTLEQASSWMEQQMVLA